MSEGKGIRCPRCGSTLLINREKHVWCSFVGGRTERACSYGIDSGVTLEDLMADLFPAPQSTHPHEVSDPSKRNFIITRAGPNGVEYWLPNGGWTKRKADALVFDDEDETDWGPRAVLSRFDTATVEEVSDAD